MRPVLKPALRACWRTPTTLQLGLDASRAVLLPDLDARDLALLGRLDGLHTETDVLARTPLDARPRASALLADLAEAGVLDDGLLPHGTAEPGERATVSLLHPWPGDAASVLAHRAVTGVEVVGDGPVAAALSELLRAAGTSPRPTVGGLLVLAPDGPGLPSRAARAAVQAGREHLVVRLVETRTVVGPHVVPGRTACLECLSLHRAGRDPAWRLAETVGAGSRVGDPRSPVLVALAAALAARQVLRAVDARPSELHDATLELDLADGLLRRRTWAPHPACACAEGAIPGDW